MKRIFAAMLVCAMMSMTACGGTATSPSPSASPSATPTPTATSTPTPSPTAELDENTDENGMNEQGEDTGGYLEALAETMESAYTGQNADSEYLYMTASADNSVCVIVLYNEDTDEGMTFLGEPNIDNESGTLIVKDELSGDEITLVLTSEDGKMMVAVGDETLEVQECDVMEALELMDYLTDYSSLFE